MLAYDCHFAILCSICKIKLHDLVNTVFMLTPIIFLGENKIDDLCISNVRSLKPITIEESDESDSEVVISGVEPAASQGPVSLVSL